MLPIRRFLQTMDVVRREGDLPPVLPTKSIDP